VWTHTADLCDGSQVSEIAVGVIDTFGGLDILVNNAGVAFSGRTHRMTPEQCERVLSVNLLAPLRLACELLPAMIERGESHILNVSSAAGLVAFSRATAYHASKFGLQGMSEALRAEYGRFGVGVTALCPGFVRTEIFDGAMNDRGSHGMRRPPDWITTSAAQVARRAVRAIRRNQPLVVMTPAARLVWWAKRLAPSLWLRIAGMRRGRRGAGRIDALPSAEHPATIPFAPHAPSAHQDASTEAPQRTQRHAA
jgi:short-subunit dehydrogenase